MIQIREPEVAVAVGLCLAARAIGFPQRTTRSHPRACGWCSYGIDVLKPSLEEFNDWAGFDDRANSTARHQTRLFAELPAAQREALIVAAQAFEEPPAPSADEAPAQPEEVMPWSL